MTKLHQNSKIASIFRYLIFSELSMNMSNSEHSEKNNSAHCIIKSESTKTINRQLKTRTLGVKFNSIYCQLSTNNQQRKGMKRSLFHMTIPLTFAVLTRVPSLTTQNPRKACLAKRAPQKVGDTTEPSCPQRKPLLEQGGSDGFYRNMDHPTGRHGENEERLQ